MKHTFLTSERDRLRFERGIQRVVGWLLILAVIGVLAAISCLSKP